jgi:hypothetical protein
MESFMKVKIGPYLDRLQCGLYTRYLTNKYGYGEWPDKEDETRFERFLDKLEDFIQTCYTPINYFLDKRQRKVKVHIDKWDTWGMDETLAHIVLPMLKQLKETKHGAPCVDKADTPEALWPNEAEEILYAKQGQTDIHFFARWDYVLDEMIFAFESKLTDWEEQFYSGDTDIVWTKEEDGKGFRMDKGPNDTFEVDWEGRKAYQERISNGFRLFGKYYESLWD